MKISSLPALFSLIALALPRTGYFRRLACVPAVLLGLLSARQPALGESGAMDIEVARLSPEGTFGAAFGWSSTAFRDRFVDISAGRFFAAALRQDGRILFLGNVDASGVGYHKLSEFSGVKQLACGDFHISILDANNDVWTCEHGLPEKRASNVKQIDAGYGHTVALTNDGWVLQWGQSGFWDPIFVPHAVRVESVGATAMIYHSDGTATFNSPTPGVGLQEFLQEVLPDQNITDQRALVKQLVWHEGSQTILLRKDGSILISEPGSGGENWVPMLDNIGPIAQVGSGWTHRAAVKTNGTVVAWGDNCFEQSAVPAGLTNVVKVEGTKQGCLALKSDGSIVTWGDRLLNRQFVDTMTVSPVALPVPVIGAEDQLHPAPDGRTGGYILRKEGSVALWGPPPPSWPTAGLGQVKEMSTKPEFTVALRSSGEVTSFPMAVPASLGLCDRVFGLPPTDEAGNTGTALARRLDGTVVTWGAPLMDSGPMPDLANLTAIIRPFRRIGAWPNNTQYLLMLFEDGHVEGRNVPVPAGLGPVAEISVNNGHWAVRQTNEQIVSWGDTSQPLPEFGPGAWKEARNYRMRLVPAAKPWLRITPEKVEWEARPGWIMEASESMLEDSWHPSLTPANSSDVTRKQPLSSLPRQFFRQRLVNP